MDKNETCSCPVMLGSISDELIDPSAVFQLRLVTKEKVQVQLPAFN